MANRNRNWIIDELILVLDLYFRLPLSKVVNISEADHAIVALSGDLNLVGKILGLSRDGVCRSPAAVKMKLHNFLRLDPAYSGKGLSGGSKTDLEVWQAYSSDRDRLSTASNSIRRFAREDVSFSMPTLHEDAIRVTEGQLLLRVHLARERNRHLVASKKALVKRVTGILACEICGFSFAEVYGELGEAFIECHHKRPLSDSSPLRETRLKDLALVCSNCHSMLHVRPQITMDGLKQIVACSGGYGL